MKIFKKKEQPVIIEKKFSCEEVMRDVLDRGLDWYDYKELPYAEQISYWNEAQSIVKNNVFLNEYNHFLAEVIKQIAKDMPVEQIKYARFGVVAMEAFKKHLEEINNPDTQETYNEIHESI